MKLLLLPVLLLFSSLLAGIFGVVHNQISYSVSPGYFHEFKFFQFGIESALQNRIGASIVGYLGSWRMGFLIGLPIYIAAFFIKETRKFLHTFLVAAVIVVIVTLLSGLGALGFSYRAFSLHTLPTWAVNIEVTDPLAFARAGTMHNFSYLGGAVGMLVGLSYVILQVRKSNKRVVR